MNSWQKFKKVVWLTFTESNERYLDLTRIGYALVLTAALVYAGWSVIVDKKEFSMTDFGTGICLILFGGGAGIGIRTKLEEDHKTEEVSD